MSVRAVAISLIVALSGGPLAMGQPTKNPGKKVPDGWRFPVLKEMQDASKAGRSQSAAADLLKKVVGEVTWEENTFEEVLAWLSDQGEGTVNVLPKWSVLRAANVTEDSLVTLKLSNVQVAVVLNEVLAQLSQGDPLSYRATGNILRLSTKSDFASQMEVRVYQIMDLGFRIPDMGRNAPTVDLQSASRSGGSGGGGGGQSVFSNSGSSNTEDLEDEEQELKERLDGLVGLIQAVVEPTSWNTAGGPGHVQHINGRLLVVRNSAEVQEKLVGYFALGK